MKITRNPLKWKIRSSADPYRFHIVSYHKKFGWKCSCQAYVYSMGKVECRHIKLAKKKT